MSAPPGKNITLYLTETEPCSYLDGKWQKMVVVDPLEPLNKDLVTYFSTQGFRRSGNMTYRPNCSSCAQCISVRIPVNEFTPSKSQRRVKRKNRDLYYRIQPAEDAEQFFDLYYRYQQDRHGDGIMCDPSVAKYKSFIDSSFADTRLLVLYDDDKAVSVTVIDLMHDGFSAVYTFYDPLYHHNSLGTFAVLSSLDICYKYGFDYVYLGFWVADSPKMNYKTKFQPLEGYINNRWQKLPPAK